MVDYVRAIATAQRLIKDAGRSVTLQQFSSTSKDPEKPWKGAEKPRGEPSATLALDAVFVEPSSAVRLGLLATDDDLVKRSEQIAMCAPGATTDVRAYQAMVDGSSTYKIMGARVLRPGEEIVLAFIGVRR